MKVLKSRKDWQELNQAAYAASVYGEWEKVNDIGALLKMKPYMEGYENVDGSCEKGVFVYIAGKEQLDYEYFYRHGDTRLPEEYEDAPTIGEQIVGKKVKFLEVVIWVDNSYDNEKWEKSFIVELIPLDIKKIRRRVEDALRKTNDTNLIVRLANELGVKLV